MSDKLFRPMLAAKPKPEELDEALAKLTFPLIGSPKLDGIRCTVQDGKLYSRSLKLIPNLAIQKRWSKAVLNGVDGELIVGGPTAADCFNRTTSIVMSQDKPADDVAFYVFDKYHASDPFMVRHNKMKALDSHGITVVPHVSLKNLPAVHVYEALQVGKGHEGIMLRSLEGLYKQGRSTLKEQGLIAVKRFVDAEAVVLDTYEQMENTNPQEENELGRSKRSSHKAGKIGKGILGGFNVVACEKNGPFGTTPFKIGTGTGLTQELRAELWTDRTAQVGRIIKYRYQAVGSMERPRILTWQGFRDEKDL